MGSLRGRLKTFRRLPSASFGRMCLKSEGTSGASAGFASRVVSWKDGRLYRCRCRCRCCLITHVCCVDVLTLKSSSRSVPTRRYILVYPQGCDVSNHLSLFLCVADYDKLLPGTCMRVCLCRTRRRRMRRVVIASCDDHRVLTSVSQVGATLRNSPSPSSTRIPKSPSTATRCTGFARRNTIGVGKSLWNSPKCSMGSPWLIRSSSRRRCK